MKRWLTLLALLIVFSPGQPIAKEYDVAAGPTGPLVMAWNQDALSIFCDYPDGRKLLHRVPDSGQVRDYAVSGNDTIGLACWIRRTEDTTSLEGIIIDGEGNKSAIKSIHIDPAEELEVSALEDGSYGILLVGTNNAQWVSCSSGSATFKRESAVQIFSPASTPSVLQRGDIYTSWQERGENTEIVISKFEDGFREVTRLDTVGFAGSASPQLIWAGKPAVVWQEEVEGAVQLVARNIESDGTPVSIPVPEEITGALISGAVIGADDQLLAYGWNWNRWVALQYDFSRGIEVASVTPLRNEKMNIRQPLAVANNGTVHLFAARSQLAPPVNLRGDSLDSKLIPMPSIDLDIENINILAFGDSITRGWLDGEPQTPGFIPKLEDLVSTILGPVYIIQSGVGGEKSPEGLIRLKAELLTYTGLDFVLILEGTNDPHYKTPLTIEDSIDSLISMVEAVRNAGAMPILGTMTPRSRGRVPQADIRAGKLSTAIIAAAIANGVSLGRFQSLYIDKEEYFSDANGRRLHPSLIGYDLMAEIWMQALLTFYGDVTRDSKIDVRDYLRMNMTMNRFRGQQVFNADCDLNDDGVVDVRDLSPLVKKMGTIFRELP